MGKAVMSALLVLVAGHAAATAERRNGSADDRLALPNSERPAAETLRFNAVSDFSRTQGGRCWYYMYNFDTAMTFGVNWWGDSSWCDPDGACAIKYEWMHPGIGSGSECNVATRKWLSPASGQVRVTGDVHKMGPLGIGGGGVIAGIYLDTSLLWSRYIAGDDTIGFIYDLALHVAEGDALFFALDADGDNWYDSSSFNSTITLVTALLERPSLAAIHPPPAPTIARGVLNMGQWLTADDSRFGVGLYDANGRKAMALAPGSNDVRALAPGVYFVFEHAAGGRKQAANEERRTTKVVIQR